MKMKKNKNDTHQKDTVYQFTENDNDNANQFIMAAVYDNSDFTDPHWSTSLITRQLLRSYNTKKTTTLCLTVC